MKWTQQHSRNAVAAKARLRMERAADPEVGFATKVFTPRPRPDFTINIRSRSGERAQITVTRIGKRFLTSSGWRSARSIGRGIETLLRHCTP